MPARPRPCKCVVLPLYLSLLVCIEMGWYICAFLCLCICACSCIISINIMCAVCAYDLLITYREEIRVSSTEQSVQIVKGKIE